MKNTFKHIASLGLLLLLTAAPLFSQQSVQSTYFGSVTTGTTIRQIGSGVGYHGLSWYKTGTVSACSVRVDSSVDGTTWNAGDVVAAQTCTSTGSTAAWASGTFNYLRVNVTAYTGTGTVNVVYKGYVANPTPGGTPGGAVNSVQYNNAGALGGFGSWDGTTLDLSAGKLETSTYIYSDNFCNHSTHGQCLFQYATGAWAFTDNVGTNVLELANTMVRVLSTVGYTWSSSAANAGVAADTGLSRVSANVIGVGNGTVGDVSGTLKAATINASSSIGVGTAPTACGSATACLGGTENSVAGTPTAGQSYFRFSSTSHNILFSFNNGAEGPLNILSGGTGTASTLTGLVRGSASAMTAAELSGDATTSGSNAVTVVKANGISMPSSVTSGGIPYYSSTSAMASSALLTVNVLVKGGGAGAAPANSLLTDNATSLTYTGTGGMVAPLFTSNGSGAGALVLTAGTAQGHATASTVTLEAGATTTAYEIVLPLLANSGVLMGSTSSAKNTLSSSGDANHSVHVTAQTATKTIYSLCPAANCPAGQYRINWYFNQGGTACGTPTGGTVTFALTWTDNAGAHSAIALPMNDASSIAVFGTVFNAAASNTTAYASGEFNIWSTGAQPIQVTNTYAACAVGTFTWELAATVEQVQ